MIQGYRPPEAPEPPALLSWSLVAAGVGLLFATASWWWPRLKRWLRRRGPR